MRWTEATIQKRLREGREQGSGADKRLKPSLPRAGLPPVSLPCECCLPSIHAWKTQLDTRQG